MTDIPTAERRVIAANLAYRAAWDNRPANMDREWNEWIEASGKLRKLMEKNDE